MAVLKEFRCIAHGPFDSREAVCPHGCTTVIREFRTPVATRSEKTRRSDTALESLAKRFGLGDMSNRSGSVGGSRRHKQDFAPIWGELPQGNVYEVGKGERGRDGAPVIEGGGAAAAMGNLAVPIGGKPLHLNMRHHDAEVAALERESGAAPSFMDVAKHLPRPRAHPVGREKGDAGDLAKAIDQTPA